MHRTHRVATVWLALLGAFAAPAEAKTAPLATHQAALRAFYTATNGPNWARSEGWSANGEIRCDAEGLTCDDAGNVQEIFLVDNGLEGELPADIAEIDTLRGLVLNRNRLHGHIPRAWSRMATLQLLSLRDNQVEGELDTSLADINALKVLDLCHNALHGAVPDAYLDMPNLGALAVCNNDFASSLPAVGRATALYDLDLSGNAFSGTIDPGYFELPALWRLSLRDNALSGQLPENLAAAAPLVSLDLADNRLSGRLESRLAQFRDLSDVNINRNRFRGPLPDSFRDMPRLRRFSASGNRITGGVPASLATHAELTDSAAVGNVAVDLAWNPLTVDNTARAQLESLGTDTDTLVLPVGNVQTQSNNTDLTVSWTATALPEGTAGHYRVETEDGSLLAETEDLDTDTITVSAPAGTSDVINVVTVVLAHEGNPNVVESDTSDSDSTTPINWTPQSVSHPVNHGAFSQPDWAPIDNDTDTVIGDISDTTLFSDGPHIAADGSLHFTPSGRVGTAQLSVEFTSGNTTQTHAFSIEIGVAANRAPTFESGGAVETDALGTLQIVEWASALDDGDGGSQSMRFVIDNPDSTFFAFEPDVSVPSGTLRFRVNPGVTGSIEIGVQLVDNGGTANGGKDSSARHVLTITATDPSQTTAAAGLASDTSASGGGGALGVISAVLVLLRLARAQRSLGSIMRRRLVARRRRAVGTRARRFEPL